MSSDRGLQGVPYGIQRRRCAGLMLRMCRVHKEYLSGTGQSLGTVFNDFRQSCTHTTR